MVVVNAQAPAAAAGTTTPTRIPVRCAQPVSRHLPPHLRGLLRTGEWQAFCHDYDQLVVDKYGMIRYAQCGIIAGPLLGILIFILGMVKTMNRLSKETNYNRDTNLWEDDNGDSSGIHPAIVIGPVLFISLPLAIGCWLARLNQQFLADMEDFVGRYNQKYPQLNFVFQEDVVPHSYRDSDGYRRTTSVSRYYIQITPHQVVYNNHDNNNDVDVEAPTPTVWGEATMAAAPTPVMAEAIPVNDEYTNAKEGDIVVPTAPTEHDLNRVDNNDNNNHAATPRQRLEKLDRIRDILSEEEYQRKRQDILNSL